jgi:hypothetical protein
VASSSRSILAAGVGGAVVAGVVDLAVFATARAAGASFEFVQNGRPTEVGYGMVVAVPVGAILLGTVLAALLGARRLRLAQLIGAVVAVLSTAGPLTLSGPGSSKAVLVLLHLLTGAAFVVALEMARRRAATDSPTAAGLPA